MHSILRRAKFAVGYFPWLSGKDQKGIVAHARYRRIERYDFTRREYLRLRNLAEKMYLKQQLIAEFDKHYTFIRRVPKLKRSGRFNSMTGMNYDWAIAQYAEIARVIEKTKQDFDAA